MSNTEKDLNERFGYPVASLGMMSHEEMGSVVGEEPTDQEINIRKAEAIAFSEENISVVEGQSKIVRVAPTEKLDSCPALMWESSDESIAKVSDRVIGANIEEPGVAQVLGIKKGTATISATSVDYTLTCSANVEVTEEDEKKEKYNIEISASENGSVEADKTSAEEGESVTLTVTADEGYELEELSVKQADETEVEVVENVFEMPASDVTVTASFCKSEIVSDSYDYIYNEASWNASYENGALKAYYEKYPNEDLWNPVAHKPASFNDKYYAVSIYQTAAGTGLVKSGSFVATWISDTVQKITNELDNTEIYYLDMFYSLDENTHELFTDQEMTETAGVYAKFTSVSYPKCIHCWEGAVNAPGAKYPWIAPYFEYNVNSKIKFEYEGLDSVMPWGDKVFNNETLNWGCASVSSEFNEPSFLIHENGNPGESTFDVAKFKMILIPNEEA